MELPHLPMQAPTFWAPIELMPFFLPRVLAAVLCGGLIGLERELKHKVAGVKTNMLICVGSALYTSVSMLISSSYAEQGHYGDPARIAAQIVSGIGFLGGGAIIQARGTVLGLTTAATIWVVAAIGICIGIGYIGVAVGASLFVVATLVLTTFLENRFLDRAHSYLCEVLIDDPAGQVRAKINESLQANELELEDFDVSKNGDLDMIRIKYHGSRSDHRKLVMELWSTPGVRLVKQR